MAVAPTLGTGIFIASGQALAIGGPLSLLLSYLFLSALTYSSATAVAEVAVHNPIHHGTMFKYGSQYLAKGFGVTLGYLRWYTLGMFIPYEMSTGMVNVGKWTPEPYIAVRLALVSTVISAFNFLPERVFKRSEAIFTGLKLLTLLGLIFVSMLLAFKESPGGTLRGFSYWYDPGAMREYLVNGAAGRFLGLLQCLNFSAIGFVFIPELIATKVEDTEVSPHLNTVLTEIRQGSNQITTLYLLHALAIGMVIPWDEPGLIYGHGSGHSPYVLGLEKANVIGLPALARVLILLSTVSSARSFMFNATRTLASLSENGHAPQILSIRNRWGVPYVSVISSLPFVGLGWLCLSQSSSSVVNWYMHFVSASGHLSLICNCLLNLRFRRSVLDHDVPLTRRSRTQPWASYFGIGSSSLLLLANLLSFSFPGQLSLSQSIGSIVAIVIFFTLLSTHRLIVLNETGSSDTRQDSPEEDGPPTADAQRDLENSDIQGQLSWRQKWHRLVVGLHWLHWRRKHADAKEGSPA